jgi:glycosyltransferase involved in cell wall biosynthesis
MPRLAHFVSLQGPAGVERHFAEFALQAASRYPAWAQSWLNPDKGIDSTIAATLGSTLERATLAKYRWGIKLPAKPGAIRAWNCRGALVDVDVLLIWNRTARSEFVIDAIGEDRCVHWEHGSVWHSGREGERERYLKRIRLAITNSMASARVLELMWGFVGETRVCVNALRPSLMPPEPISKPFPAARAVRLGVAARLVPVKGVAVVLHSAAKLRAIGMNVEVHVAGTGAERERLVALASRLKIDESVRFHGLIDDMAAFYRDIDCLLHVPLTEAFGLVTIEAAAQGCPAIVAAVDGLPEAVEHGVSGCCLDPTVSLADYAELAGADYGIPAKIYDPAHDELMTPKAVDPTVLADAVRDLFSERSEYERLSRSASEHVLSRRRFDRHVDDVMSVINEFVSQ